MRPTTDVDFLNYSGMLTEEDARREAELYRDLKDTERRIGKEVWDIEEVENRE